MVNIMKQVIELNKEDIARLVAKEFNVEEKQVSVCTKPVYYGYGIYEHKEYEVCVTVNK